MKLQNMTVIFSIIVIPITLILSAYIGIQIDTQSIQQNYDTKLLDATHDAVLAFQLNTKENDYSTNADSLRRDIKASINALFTSLATNIGVPGENSSYITAYIPAVVFTLYDGYYIYSPVETEYTDIDGTTKTKYEHVLKPYIHYSVRYKEGANDIVVNYSLDNYITIYGYVNGDYISKAGYLIANAGDVSEDGTSYLNRYGKKITVTDTDAVQYFKLAKEFTNWVKDSGIVAIVTPNNVLDSNGNSIEGFRSDNTKILNLSQSNDPDDENSDFTAHKKEIMKLSIQSNLNSAIAIYSKHTILSTDFRMPVLKEEDWDKILSNVNVISFMQGLPVGTKTYNNYAIVTSTENKQYIDPELLYFLYDGYYHKITCPKIQDITSPIEGHRSIDYIGKRQDDGSYVYNRYNGTIPLACYECIIGSKEADELKFEINTNLQESYYNTLARERLKLYKAKVT